MVRGVVVRFGLSLALTVLATALFSAPAHADPASAQAVDLIGCIPAGSSTGHHQPPCDGARSGEELSTGLAPDALGSGGTLVWNIATAQPDLTDVDLGPPVACPSSTGLALDGAGNLYVANPCPNDGYVYSGQRGGTPLLIGNVGKPRVPPGPTPSTSFPLPASRTNFEGPRSLAVNSAHDIYICDSHRILEYSPDGVMHYIGGEGALTRPDGEPAAQASFDCTSIALDRAGDLYGLGDGTLYEIGLDGVFHVIETDMPLPAGVARSGNALTVGPDGDVYVALGDHVVAVGPDGGIQTVAGGGSTALIQATWTSCQPSGPRSFCRRPSFPRPTWHPSVGHVGYSFNGPGLATSYALSGVDTVTTLSDGNIGIGVQYPSYTDPARQGAGDGVGVVIMEIAPLVVPPDAAPETSEVVALPLLAALLLGTYWAISRCRRRPQGA